MAYLAGFPAEYGQPVMERPNVGIPEMKAEIAAGSLRINPFVKILTKHFSAAGKQRETCPYEKTSL